MGFLFLIRTVGTINVLILWKNKINKILDFQQPVKDLTPLVHDRSGIWTWVLFLFLFLLQSQCFSQLAIPISLRPKLGFEFIYFAFSKCPNSILPYCLKFKNIRMVAYCLYFFALWFPFVSHFLMHWLCKPTQDPWTLCHENPSFYSDYQMFLGPMLMFVFHFILFYPISPAFPIAALIPGDQASKNVHHAECHTAIFSISFYVLDYGLFPKHHAPRYSLYLVIS